MKKHVIPRRAPVATAMAGGGDKGDGSSSPSTVVMEHVTTVNGEIPKLTKANYHDWALEVHVNLEGMELWDAVESGTAKRSKDRQVLAVILRGVPPEMKSGLAAKKTVKDAWAAVKSLRKGDVCVQEAKAQHLIQQFENMTFKDGESIEDFAVRIGSLAAELRELGETMGDERVVKKMLRVVPARLNQIACSIEMFGDLKTLSLEELVGRLRVAEERCCGVQAVEDGAGRLLLTEEQWEARCRQRRSKERSGGGDKRGGKEGGGGDDDDGSSSTYSENGERKSKNKKGKCYNCSKRGHFAHECPKKKQEEALLATADDEPTLL